MKKNFLFSFLVTTLFISCNEESSTIAEETAKIVSIQKNNRVSQLPQSEKRRIASEFFENLSKSTNATSGRVRGFCHSFKVKGKLLGIEIETTIYLCCTTLTMNCTPIPEKIINNKSLSGKVLVEEFEIVDSSIYENEDGTKIRIKKGVYDISSGYVQFELEELK